MLTIVGSVTLWEDGSLSAGLGPRRTRFRDGQRAVLPHCSTSDLTPLPASLAVNSDYLAVTHLHCYSMHCCFSFQFCGFQIIALSARIHDSLPLYVLSWAMSPRRRTGFRQPETLGSSYSSLGWVLLKSRVSRPSAGNAASTVFCGWCIRTLPLHRSPMSLHPDLRH